jgi:CRISPR system Cascade subunit CasB
MNEHARDFITHLTRLQEQDRRAIAVLRRSLSFPPGRYPPAYPYVERFVGADRHEADPFRLALYLVAGLFALHPHNAPCRLATSLGELKLRRDSDSIEKRFIALLGADSDNLEQYLHQIVTLLAADDCGLDYVALLSDLPYWLNPNATERRDQIRQHWARDFYRVLAPRDVSPDPTTSRNTVNVERKS